MHRRTRLTLLAVFATAAIGVWAWRLTAPSPAEPPLPAALDEMDPAVAALIRNAAAAVRLHPSDARVWHRLAMVYHANGLPVLAAQCYGTTIELDPAQPKAWYRLALTRGDLADLPGAIEAGRVAASRTDYPPAHWRLGFWLLDQGDLDEAERAFRDALDAGDPAGRFGLARVFLQRQEPDEAVALLEPIAMAPGPVGAYANQLLGLAYRGLDRMDDAETAFLRARGAKAEFVDPWRTEVMTLRPGLESRLDTAKRLMQQARVRDALTILETTRQDHPGNANVLNNLGIAYRAAGRLEDSQRVLDEAVQRQPDFCPARLSLALTLLARAGDARQTRAEAPALRARALDHLNAALTVNPSYAPALGTRAAMLAEADRLDEALAGYLDASRCEPGNPFWLLEAGRLQLRLEQWRDAASSLERVTALAPIPEAMLGLARALLELGLYDDAEDAIEEARTIDPTLPGLSAMEQELQQRRQRQGASGPVVEPG